ncbi:hypothetical protein QQ054_18375 [Oscillatoria amoena NRMC-F 0135]|nr:hypothetical protein [Oscillatoria amoena NRMC-F 0135]
MHNLKSITEEGIPRALEKVERYRLLNEPAEAESICRDILAVDPNHQKALMMLILSLSDQFVSGMGESEAKIAIGKLKDDYKRTYYTGILNERLAKAAITRGTFGSHFDAYEWLQEAIQAFEKAISIRPAGNDDAILRYNACLRTIQRHNLTARPKEREPLLE